MDVAACVAEHQVLIVDSMASVHEECGETIRCFVDKNIKGRVRIRSIGDCVSAVDANVESTNGNKNFDFGLFGLSSVWSFHGCMTGIHTAVMVLF